MRIFLIVTLLFLQIGMRSQTRQINQGDNYRRDHRWSNRSGRVNEERINPVEKSKMFYENGNRRISRADYIGAIDEYNHALLNNPNFWQAQFNRGKAYLFLGNYQSAFNDFWGIMYSIPKEKSSELLYCLSLCYYNTQDYQTAKINLDLTITLSLSNLSRLNRQDLGEAYYYRALCNIQLNDYSSICSDLVLSISMGHLAARELMKEYCR
jgi:tetratricopeptide (TPR) repeat protein